MTKRVYLVKELHGAQTTIIGVCASRELATLLCQKSISHWDLEGCEITKEMFDQMLMQTNADYDFSTDILENLILKFPEYSVSDIEKAYGEYTHQSYTDTVIEEVDFFDSITNVENLWN